MSPDASRVAFVAPPGKGRILLEAATMLEERGCAVARFESSAELDACQRVLETVEVLASAATIADPLLAKAPRLRALVSPWTGTDMFDTAGAKRRGLTIANGQIEQNYVSMAEATIMLMLVASYDLDSTRAAIDSPRPPAVPLRARMLMGRTVGIIGHGMIARAVLDRLASWNVRALVYHRGDRDLPPFASSAPLETVLAASDIVSIHLPLTPETRHLLDEKRLRLLKTDAALINTARGAIIDETALAAVALDRPDLRFAIDTFEVEPLPHDSPLRRLPNVILTPHSVGHTRDTISRLPGAVVANVIRLLGG